jgi:hypothetical protein
MYACMCRHIYMCVCVCVCVDRASFRTGMYVCMHAYLCMYAYTLVCMYVELLFAQVCMYA